jgi:hypothetical protein
MWGHTLKAPARAGGAFLSVGADASLIQAGRAASGSGARCDRPDCQGVSMTADAEPALAVSDDPRPPTAGLPGAGCRRRTAATRTPTSGAVLGSAIGTVFAPRGNSRSGPVSDAAVFGMATASCLASGPLRPAVPRPNWPPAAPMSQTHRPYRGSPSWHPSPTRRVGESRGVDGPGVAAGDGGGLTPDDARTNLHVPRTGSPVAVRDQGRRAVRRRIFGARLHPDRAHRYFSAAAPVRGRRRLSGSHPATV